MSKKDEIPRQAKTLNLQIEQISRTKSIFNVEQVQKIFSTTPKKYKYERPAKGGGKWTYAKIGYIRKALDGLFGFNWDFEIETTLSEAFEVALQTKVCVVKGRLIGRVTSEGKEVTLIKTQFGRAEVKFKTEKVLDENGRWILVSNKNGKKVYETKPSKEPLDFGNDMKAASTDALKKCAALFGIAADLYEADDFEDVIIKGSEREKREEEKVREPELPAISDEDFEKFARNGAEYIKKHENDFDFTEEQRNILRAFVVGEEKKGGKK